MQSVFSTRRDKIVLIIHTKSSQAILHTIILIARIPNNIREQSIQTNICGSTLDSRLQSIFLSYAIFFGNTQ